MLPCCSVPPADFHNALQSSFYNHSSCKRISPAAFLALLNVNRVEVVASGLVFTSDMEGDEGLGSPVRFLRDISELCPSRAALHGAGGSAQLELCWGGHG